MPYIFVKALKRLSYVFNRLTYTLIRIFFADVQRTMARERTAQISGSPSTVLMFGTFAFNSRCGSKVRRTGDVDRQCFKTAGQVCGKKGH